jgi:hypothetical protein
MGLHLQDVPVQFDQSVTEAAELGHVELVSKNVLSVVYHLCQSECNPVIVIVSCECPESSFGVAILLSKRFYWKMTSFKTWLSREVLRTFFCWFLQS